MFLNRSRRNEQSSQRTFHRCFIPSFVSFGQAVSEEKILKNRPIRNKNCLWWLCLVMDHNKMCTLQRGPSIDASYQVSVHLADSFQRRRLKCEKLTDDMIQLKNSCFSELTKCVGLIKKQTSSSSQLMAMIQLKNSCFSELTKCVGLIKKTDLIIISTHG